MAKRNGGIIGKVNTPTVSTAKGVWRLQDQYNARKNNIWPGQPYTVDFLVIAGGGAGGFSFNSYTAGGGGAGGYRTATDYLVELGTPYSVTVGAGAASTHPQTVASNSIFSDITSAGGGFGAANGFSQGSGAGGSGGGGSQQDAPGTYNAAPGNVPATSPSQGNNGGTGDPDTGGGGGGGANAVGSDGSGSPSTRAGGAGGAGKASSITGPSVTRAGGGGGSYVGSGGSGGGGNAANSPANNGSPGSVNTGGGGGGAAGEGPGSGPNAGGTGGSGIVILKYPDSFTISNPGGGLTISTPGASGGFKVSSITAGTGNVQWS
jgi:hypothetical protein